MRIFPESDRPGDSLVPAEDQPADEPDDLPLSSVHEYLDLDRNAFSLTVKAVLAGEVIDELEPRD